MERVNEDPMDWVCMDCGAGVPETYMITDALWRQVNPFVIGVMCLQCVEDRLGRSLCRIDFTVPKDTKSAREWPGLAERFLRSNSGEACAGTIESERFEEGLAARLAKKIETQSLLGRISAEFLLERRGADLGAIPELVALLVRSGMFPAAPVEAILAMAAAGHQRAAAETLASLKANLRKEED